MCTTSIMIFKVVAFYIVAIIISKVSGNLSLYPGENGSFICEINTSIADVMFHWTKFSLDGMDTTATLSDDVDTTVGSASSTSHYSTYNITNVNHTSNGVGFRCNALGNKSTIAYLTGNQYFHE